MLRSQPVVDREPSEARLAERLEQRLDVALLVTPHEAAAMHQDAGRKRPGSLGHERIQGEADIWCSRISNATSLNKADIEERVAGTFSVGVFWRCPLGMESQRCVRKLDLRSVFG